MEDIYLKGFPRGWHSEKVDLSSYFKTYSDSLGKFLKNDKLYIKNILSAVLPNNLILSNKELAQLHKITNVTQLRGILTKENKINQHEKPSSLVRNQNLKTVSHNKGSSTQIQTLNSKKNFLTNKDCYIKGLNLNSMPSQMNANNTSHTNLTSINNTSQNVNEEDEVCSMEHNPHIQCEMYDENKTEPLLSLNNEELNHNNVKNSDYNIRKRKKSSIIYNKAIQRRERELILSHEPTCKKKKNLKIFKNFIVSFRIHDPFKHDGGGKVESLAQEILVLDNQTLDCLRDKIICQSDFQDIQGDVSEDPDKAIVKMSRDACKSAMFYFDNSFYVDKRDPDCEDYSSNIKEWGQSHGIEFGPTHDMSAMKVGNLKIRFGYPYLYKHQGNCEHLVIINDARLLMNKDSLHSCDYPMLSAIPRFNSKFCMMCLTSPGCWIVTHNSRLMYDPTLMCKTCFKMFNYIDGKKCGQFKAYHYFQKHVLL